MNGDLEMCGYSLPPHRAGTTVAWCEHENRFTSAGGTIRRDHQRQREVRAREEAGAPYEDEVRAGEERDNSAETVDHPAHYGGKDNPYEAIKVIRAWNLGFELGNCIKYVSRAGKKPGVSAVEDLEKAAWYLKAKIEQLREKDVEPAGEAGLYGECGGCHRTVARQTRSSVIWFCNGDRACSHGGRHEDYPVNVQWED